MKILVVEDAAADAALIREMLVGSDLEPVETAEASSLDEARERCAHGTFDVVLVEHQSSDGDGLDLVRELRDSAPETVVLVMASQAGAAVEDAAAQAGASDLLEKQQLTAAGLARAVRSALQRRDAQRALRAEQQHYIDLIRCLPNTGVIVCDTSQIVQTADGELLRRRGFDPQRLIGQPVPELLGRAGAEHLQHLIDAALEGHQREDLLEQEDGRSFLTRFAPLRDLDGQVTGAMTVTIDVSAQRAAERDRQRAMAELAAELSERRRAEEQLIAAEQRQRLMLMNLPGTVVALYDLDLRVLSTEGVDEAPGDLNRESVRGAHMSSFFTPEAWTTLEPIMLAARDGEPRQTEHRTEDERVMCVDVAPFRDTDGQTTGVLTVWRDITQETRDRQAREQAERHLAQTFEDAAIAMAIFDLAGRVLQANAAMAELTGYPIVQLQGMSTVELTHPADRSASAEALQQLNDGEPRVQARRRWRHAAGHDIWIEVHTTVLHRDDQPWRLLGQMVDITAQRLQESRLLHLAEHDPLTSLPNRRGFERVLEEQLRSHPGSGSLLLLDLDGFKDVNDTHGHDAGDRLLQAIAEVLDQHLGDTGVAARLGGDEFAVLLTHHDRDQTATTASELCALVAEAATHQRVPVTTSIGATLLIDPAVSGHDALERADQAMYAAKAAGRNTHAFG